MTRILQISDTHIVAPGNRANGVVDTGAALERAVEVILSSMSLIGPIDLILVTGDLTDHGLAEEYAAFRRIMAPLEGAMVAIPGNHDEREAMRRAYAGAPWMPGSGPINLRIDLADVTVLGIDTVVPGQSGGAVGAETLDWLSAALADLAPRPVLLAMHHPAIETGIALMDHQGLSNADALGAVIAGYPGPCQAVAGHAHRHISGRLRGRPFTVCPGTSHAVRLDLRGEANDTLMLEPGGVLLHVFGASEQSHLIPIGQFEGPFSFRA